MNLNQKFLNITRDILNNGYQKSDRTGTGTISFPGQMIRHDMSEGFPQLTIRKIPFKSPAVELEGFIKGITSKKWYRERGCEYWSKWAAPFRVKYGTDDETQKKMEEEDELGPIYGKQMRQFSAWQICPTLNYSAPKTIGRTCGVIDQLKNLVNELKSNPDSRRMVVSYWNPICNDLMALMPCHTHWQVNVTNNKLNLFYYMRSVDWILGNNLNSYGLLLHLLAKEAKLEEGTLIGFFADTHIYLNQIEKVKELINRDTFIPLPSIETPNFTSIFDWEHSNTKLMNYNPLEKIDFPVAI